VGHDSREALFRRNLFHRMDQVVWEDIHHAHDHHNVHTDLVRQHAVEEAEVGALHSVGTYFSLIYSVTVRYDKRIVTYLLPPFARSPSWDHDVEDFHFVAKLSEMI